jgi:hypothetical protein
MASDEQIKQRAEWRSRLMKAVIGRQHDPATLVDMFAAGLQQAYSEGVLDAADMCDTIAKRTTNERDRYVAGVLAQSMRDYTTLNNVNVTIIKA